MKLNYFFNLIFGVTPFIWLNPPLKPLYEWLIVTSLVLLQLTLSTIEATATYYRTTRMNDWNTALAFYFSIKGVCFVSNVLVLLMGWLRRKDIRNIVVGLEKIDTALESLGVTINYKLERALDICLPISGNIWLWIYICVGTYCYKKPGAQIPKLMTIWFVFEKYIYGVTLSTFIVLLQRQITLRCIALNEAMRNHFLRYQDIEDRDQKNVILSLATVFGDLEKCFREMSSCFGLQLMAFICPYMMNTIHVLFTTYFVLEGTESFTTLVGLEAAFVVVSTIFFLHLVTTATYATNEVQIINPIRIYIRVNNGFLQGHRTGRILHEIINDRQHKQLNKEVELIKYVVMDFKCDLFLALFILQADQPL